MPLDQLSHPRQVRAWFDAIPIRNQYTVGVAGEVFFRGLIEGKLMAADCRTCGKIFLPPTLYCGNCFGSVENWREIAPRGIIETFTAVYRDLDGVRLQSPEWVGLVRFDGVEGGLIHRLGEIDPPRVEIGIPVEPAFRPAEERQGSILDIAYFRPLSQG